MAQVNGAALRAIRVKDGKRLHQLAAEVGISMQYLCDIEKGRRGARPDVVKRLSVALDVPQSALTFREAS